MRKINELDIFVINEINYAINYLNGACDVISDKIVKALKSEDFEELSTREILFLLRVKMVLRYRVLRMEPI